MGSQGGLGTLHLWGDCGTQIPGPRGTQNPGWAAWWPLAAPLHRLPFSRTRRGRLPQVDGRRRGGQSSDAACTSESLACCCPRISRGKDPSIHPLTSDLHDPDSSLRAFPERSGRQAGCILQGPGAVPWGHCSSTAAQACESLWEGASRRVAATCPGRGTPEDFTEEATELGGWVWKEEEVVSSEKEDGGSIPGRTRSVNASLDHACPVLGQRGRLGPEQPLREDPTGQAHCSSFPNGNFFFWDIHIIAKMNHTERTACLAVPPIPVTMGTTGCVSFQTFPTFRWMWSLPTCWCTNGFFPSPPIGLFHHRRVHVVLLQKLLRSVLSGCPTAALLSPGGWTLDLLEDQPGAYISAQLGSNPRNGGWVRGWAQLTEWSLSLDVPPSP